MNKCPICEKSINQINVICENCGYFQKPNGESGIHFKSNGFNYMGALKNQWVSWEESKHNG